MEHYTRSNLPDAYDFGEYRKKVTTRMAPIEGPCVVDTKEGEYKLPEGWRGMLALDSAGDPYPIDQGEVDRMYELAVPE